METNAYHIMLKFIASDMEQTQKFSSQRNLT